MPVGKSLDEFIQEQEREYIEATLAKFKGSREKAASVLLLATSLAVGLYPQFLLKLIIPALNSPIFEGLRRGSWQ